MKIMFAAVVAILGAAEVGATTLDLSTLSLVAKAKTVGHYDNQELFYWNGHPLSDSNHPTEYEDELTASVSFYVDPALRDRLYVTVTDVRDTNFGYISGLPFDLVAFTALEFSLPGLGMGTLNGGVALPGEALLGPGSGMSIALSGTPGWYLSQSGNRVSLKASSVAYGLTHFPSVYGETRIYGGAAFAIDFSHGANLLHRNYRNLNVSASNGLGAYQEAGTLVYPRGVPEPASWGMMMAGFGLIGGAMRNRRNGASVA